MSSELNEMNTAETVEEKVEAEVVVEEAAPVDTRDFELRVSDADRARKKKIKEIWDKITTGILIFLMCTPILVLAYIFIWFLTK